MLEEIIKGLFEQVEGGQAVVVRRLHHGLFLRASKDGESKKLEVFREGRAPASDIEVMVCGKATGWVDWSLVACKGGWTILEK